MRRALAANSTQRSKFRARTLPFPRLVNTVGQGLFFGGAAARLRKIVTSLRVFEHKLHLYVHCSMQYGRHGGKVRGNNSTGIYNARYLTAVALI